MSVTYSGDYITFPDGTKQASASVGMKNRIINGAMVIDQRNAGASVSPANGQYIVDRWLAVSSPLSKYTIQQNAGSVTPPTGFSNYLGVTSSSAYSVSGTDAFGFTQPIEGYNVADLAWGTANAKTITVSFWVRSSLTGTFACSLQNASQNRSYPFTYTVSSANTWEQKSVTIAGDTSGTWGTTNGVGIYLWFSYGMGSTYNGTANSWQAGSYLSVSGATSVVGTNGATFYITGVQLEAGSSASSFDYRPYGTELALCQRYTQVICQTSTNNNYFYPCWVYSAGYGHMTYIAVVPFRSTPSLYQVSGSNYFIAYIGGSGYNFNSFSGNTTTSTAIDLMFSSGGAGVGYAGSVYSNNSAAQLILSAEL
jgi:hypothetical protein